MSEEFKKQKVLYYFFMSIVMWGLTMLVFNEEIKSGLLFFFLTLGCYLAVPTLAFFVEKKPKMKHQQKVTNGKPFVCTNKANGELFLCYKNGDKYSFAPYNGFEEPTKFTTVSSIEFFNIFNLNENENKFGQQEEKPLPKMRVNNERLRRMGL